MSNVFPHNEKHNRDKDVIFNVEWIQVGKTVGENGASVGGTVTAGFLLT